MINSNLHIPEEQIVEIARSLDLEDSKTLITGDYSIVVFVKAEKTKALRISDCDNVIVVPYYLSLLNCITMNIAFLEMDTIKKNICLSENEGNIENEFIENGITALIPLNDMNYIDALIKVTEGRAKILLYIISEDMEVISKRTILQSKYGKEALMKEMKKIRLTRDVDLEGCKIDADFR